MKITISRLTVNRIFENTSTKGYKYITAYCTIDGIEEDIKVKVWDTELINQLKNGSELKSWPVKLNAYMGQDGAVTITWELMSIKKARPPRLENNTIPTAEISNDTEISNGVKLEDIFPPEALEQAPQEEEKQEDYIPKTSWME